jgi:hypothetical protein
MDASMLQNRTISSSISSTVPADWGIAARRAVARERWQLLTQTVRLPDNWRAFLLFTLGIALAVAALLLHLQLSTTLLQDNLRLAALQAEEQALAKQNANLVWEIVQETELNKVKVRAMALGYQPALQRNYIVLASNAHSTDLQLGNTQPSDSQPSDPQSNLAQVDE